MAKPPSYDKIKTEVLKNPNNGKRYKQWWDKEKQGFWNVYLDSDVTPVFFTVEMSGGSSDGSWWKRDPNTGDLSGGNTGGGSSGSGGGGGSKNDVIVTTGPSPEQIAQAQLEAQRVEEARRVAQQQEDARILAEQQRQADQQRLDQQLQDEARMQEARAAEAAAGNQSQVSQQPETPAVQEAPPAAAGVPLNVGLPVDGPLPVDTASAGSPVSVQTTQQQSAPKPTGASGGGGSGAVFPRSSTYGNPGGPADGNVHTVAKGDTMWDIARANNMKLSELVALNPHVKDPHWIYPGDKINLGSKDSSVLGAETGGSGISNVATDPARVPMGGTVPPVDPFNGSKQG